MAIAISVDALSALPISASPVGGGSGGSIFAPLYDEITLQEIMAGALALQESGLGSVYLNEALSSFRSLNPTQAVLMEIAEAEASLAELLSATGTVFKH